ncbi:hypothetical protein [Thermoanaerobacter siderophilus]|uniref:Transposase n=1 Tax=Thermoanaerobacter siderophilus SR4 TaxID=880478 RepID=I9KU67_9THEO|nr:hypothetical protein [Thermoanaerobacter siderophilus]EIW00401.1 hypothetical protein ThesiDRAFT1_1463 [Thermoanaerobacter siderophilus SR4]
MPRKAREKSKTGIYHIMLRGINRETIFQSDDDYIKFISIIQQLRNNVEIIWWRWVN